MNSCQHPTLRGMLTLYTACTPCTARASHAAWDVHDLLITGATSPVGPATRSAQPQPLRRRRRQ
jgi:hypothetical protein